MKVSKLIETIRNLSGADDPEVLIDNADIYAIIKQPAFVDGCAQRIIYDGYEEIYNVELFSDGDKIILTPFPLEDILVANPNTEVVLNIHNQKLLEGYSKKVEEMRKEAQRYNEIYKTLLSEEGEEK